MTEIVARGNFISTCAGVGEDGEELLRLASVLEMIVQVNGGRQRTLVLASVE